MGRKRAGLVLLRHELWQGRYGLLLWSIVIGGMLGICILIYPQMSGQMEDISGMFRDMGGFSAAFGMDKINFGEFLGYFGVECGNVLGLGGAFFAAILGVSALAKEEKERTAEFLLTHPVSRRAVTAQKFGGMLLQILILNLAVLAVTFFAVLAVGERPQWDRMLLLFLAYVLLQVEIGAICFGISAFVSDRGVGIGLGVAVCFYFLNLIANLTEKAEFLSYVTPFGYADGADIIANGRISGGYLAVELCFGAAGTAAGFLRYRKKDIGA